MIEFFAKFPILKRLIPSIGIRLLKILKKSRGYYKIKNIYLYLDFLDPIDRQIIIYGESLGTGVSAEVAQHKKFAGIILESPFTSMVEAGKHYYFYLPVSLLLKDRYETLKKLKNIKIPILVMHGENDRIVPFHMGKKVFLEANEPKYSYFPKDDDHMMDYNENLLKAGEHYGIKNLFIDFDDFIKQTNPDLICLATRTNIRADLIKKISTYGINYVHLEKPLCNSVNELRELEKNGELNNLLK